MDSLAKLRFATFFLREIEMLIFCQYLHPSNPTTISTTHYSNAMLQKLFDAAAACNAIPTRL